MLRKLAEVYKLKRQDPRVTRTERLLMDALMNLILEEGYDAITVRDIVQKAGMNRSTFYLHFRDKQDIMSHLENDLLAQLTEALIDPTYSQESARSDYQTFGTPSKTAVALFSHVEKYAPLYRTMLVERDFRARVTHSIRQDILPLMSHELDAAFGSNGIVGVIIHWLESGMAESVTDMSLWLTRMSLFPMGITGNSNP